MLVGVGRKIGQWLLSEIFQLFRVMLMIRLSCVCVLRNEIRVFNWVFLMLCRLVLKFSIWKLFECLMCSFFCLIFSLCCDNVVVCWVIWYWCQCVLRLCIVSMMFCFRVCWVFLIRIFWFFMLIWVCILVCWWLRLLMGIFICILVQLFQLCELLLLFLLQWLWIWLVFFISEIFYRCWFFVSIRLRLVW